MPIIKEYYLQGKVLHEVLGEGCLIPSQTELSTIFSLNKQAIFPICMPPPQLAEQSVNSINVQRGKLICIS